jgi:hypothetical protein
LILADFLADMVRQNPGGLLKISSPPKRGGTSPRRHFASKPPPSMNNNTVALQQARVASFATLALQAISEFSSLDADEDEKQKRAKSSPNQRCRWAEYVRLSKDKPMFRRHLRMTYHSFCLLLNQIQEHLHAPDDPRVETICNNSLPCWYSIHGYLLLLRYFTGSILFYFMGDNPCHQQEHQN